MSAENALDKLKPNGLKRVRAYIPWQESQTNEIDIYFAAPKRSKTAAYLSKQIEEAACNECPLKDIYCTGVKVDDLKQMDAILTTSTALDRNGWKEKFSTLPCKPELIK